MRNWCNHKYPTPTLEKVRLGLGLKIDQHFEIMTELLRNQISKCNSISKISLPSNTIFNYLYHVLMRRVWLELIQDILADLNILFASVHEKLHP